MLILPDGRRIGALSGGCLESDVAERARQVMAGGEPCLVEYNAKTGFDVVEEMGCRGALSILVERVSRPETTGSLQFLADCIRHRYVGVLATVFRVEGSLNVEVGQRLACSLNEVLCGIENTALCEAVKHDACEAAVTKRSFVKNYTLSEGTVEVFLEVIQPPLSLTILGAGDDAIPLARFASLLGWQTTLLDHRPAFATLDRFPMADRLLPGCPDAALDSLALDERSAVVLMSHNYEQDRAFLNRLVSANVPYIGILGPVKRTDRLLNDIRADGIFLSEDFLARLHSPAGLDIGSETPEEIALSIVSEIQAAHTQTTSGSLRDRAASLNKSVSGSS